MKPNPPKHSPLLMPFLSLMVIALWLAFNRSIVGTERYRAGFQDGFQAGATGTIEKVNHLIGSSRGSTIVGNYFQPASIPTNLPPVEISGVGTNILYAFFQPIVTTNTDELYERE